VRPSVWVIAFLIVVSLVAGAVVALAGSASAEPGRSPAIWRSADGADWVHTPLEWDADQRLVAVAAADLGLVAVGTGHDGGTIWTSSTGEEWRCTWDAEGFDPKDVTGGGPGWVVVGGSWDGTIHTSADGVSWRRVFGEPATAFWAVESLDATLVAAGGSWAGGDEVVAAVWVSDDAEQWSRLELPQGEGAQVAELVRLRSGLLAVAETGALWFSSDGRAWERWQTEGLDPMGLTAVAATDSLFLAGWEWSGDAAIWLSADGSSWQVMTPPEEWEPHGAMAEGDRFIALGQHGDCQASVLSVTDAGGLEDLGATASTWLSSECLEGIPINEDDCEPTSARAADAVQLPDGSLVVVGHW
jgi:hypothetical protein